MTELAEPLNVRGVFGPAFGQGSDMVANPGKPSAADLTKGLFREKLVAGAGPCTGPETGTGAGMIPIVTRAGRVSRAADDRADPAGAECSSRHRLLPTA